MEQKRNAGQRNGHFLRTLHSEIGAKSPKQWAAGPMSDFFHFKFEIGE